MFFARKVIINESISLKYKRSYTTKKKLLITTNLGDPSEPAEPVTEVPVKPTYTPKPTYAPTTPWSGQFPQGSHFIIILLLFF